LCALASDIPETLCTHEQYAQAQYTMATVASNIRKLTITFSSLQHSLFMCKVVGRAVVSL
jgi:hypothetical protein